jgi:hypothetical protein
MAGEAECAIGAPINPVRNFGRAEDRGLDKVTLSHINKGIVPVLAMGS